MHEVLNTLPLYGRSPTRCDFLKDHFRSPRSGRRNIAPGLAASLPFEFRTALGPPKHWQSYDAGRLRAYRNTGGFMTPESAFRIQRPLHAHETFYSIPGTSRRCCRIDIVSTSETLLVRLISIILDLPKNNSNPPSGSHHSNGIILISCSIVSSDAIRFLKTGSTAPGQESYHARGKSPHYPPGDRVCAKKKRLSVIQRTILMVQER